MTPFEQELIEMRHMYFPLEQQFIEFNEIIPFRYHEDWHKVTSPRLANLMLSVCPQIEKMLKILTQKMNLKTEKESPKFYDYISILDSKKMLSEQTVGLPDPGYANILFTPYEKNSENILDWWYGYNKIKHELPGGITYGTLHNAINSLAALSILHHVALTLLPWGKKDYEEILDSKKWYFDEDDGIKTQVKNENRLPNELPVWWSSKIFFFPTKRFHTDSTLSGFKI